MRNDPFVLSKTDPDQEKLLPTGKEWVRTISSTPQACKLLIFRSAVLNEAPIVALLARADVIRPRRFGGSLFVSKRSEIG